MSLADDLAKLEELRRAGALTDAEFAQAKAKLLAGDAAPANASVVEKLGEQLAETRYQNELARIDREWEIEKEKYMNSDRYGRRYVPTTRRGWSMAGIAGGMGVVWTVMAINMFSGVPDSAEPGVWRVVLPLVGVLITIGAIWSGAHEMGKAGAYNKASADYQKRRAAVKPEDIR